MNPAFPFPLSVTSGPGALCQRLHRQIRDAIVDGRLKPGLRMPSTRAAARSLGISRSTVGASYDLLVAEGYLIARKGTCAVVAQVSSRKAVKLRPVQARLPQIEINPIWEDWFATASPRAGLPASNFRTGVPDHRYFPHAIWRRISASALRQSSRRSFAYAPSEGLPELRSAISDHVAFARAVSCTPEDVIVTSGAQQALDLIARLLVTAGKTLVAVESPGYPPHRYAFRASGARLVNVPVDDEGLRVDLLPDDTKVIVVTPSHQSPTGVVMSMARRAALLQFASRRGAVVVEDDYDGEFRFGTGALDSLQTLDRDGHVFYVGTFAKSLFPSLRKGFVIAPEWAVERLAKIKHCTDSHCDTMTQSVLASFIREGHLARHVRRMHKVYGERRLAVLQGLQRSLGDWLVPIPSEAGLHLAARVREQERMPALASAIKQHMPGTQTISEYSESSQTGLEGFLFGYGAIEVPDIGLAIARVAKVLGVTAR